MTFHNSQGTFVYTQRFAEKDNEFTVGFAFETELLAENPLVKS